MTICESIIAAQTNINAETDVLAAIAGTSLTTRSGWGRAYITHALANTDTDDIQEVYCTPSGYNDPNGFEIEAIDIYSAVTSHDIREARLPKPIVVSPNTPLVISARSETAANSRCSVWMNIEYPEAPGPFMPIKTGGGLVRRAWEHGAALVSNTPANSTNITDLQAGREYQLSGIGKAAVNGGTAGLVGDCYWGLQTNHTGGGVWYLPLCNANNYVTAGSGIGWIDLAECGLKAPIIAGGQPLLTRAVGFTAEQPQAILQLGVDKVFA